MERLLPPAELEGLEEEPRSAEDLEFERRVLRETLEIVLAPTEDPVVVKGKRTFGEMILRVVKSVN